MHNALVVGANGYIGRELIKELISNDVAVTAVVHNNNRSNIVEDNSIKIVSFNDCVSSLKKELGEKQFDVMYYLAWTGVSSPLRTNYDVQLNNVKQLLDFIRFSKEINCKKIIITGSIMEFETMEATYGGNTNFSLSHIYGAAKVASHMMALPLATNLNIDICWAVITNTFGPGENSPRLINSTIRKCLNNEEPEFTAATQLYDFVYIDDAVHALFLIGKLGKNAKTYMICGPEPRPLKSFLEELRSLFSPQLSFKYGSMPYAGIDLPPEVFNSSLTKNDTGFEPRISFREGCLRTIEWIKNNDD